MSQSTGSRTSRKALVKPKKPYPKFPLSPHSTGKWQKKILKKIHYFGNWARRINGKLVRVEDDGWKEALELYNSQAPYLHAGQIPPVETDGLTIIELCNKFLQSKERKVESGELSVRMFADYKEIKNLLLDTFGASRQVQTLIPDDFERLRATMAKKWGPIRLGNTIVRVKSFFKYGVDNELIDRAIRYGSEFKKPDKAVLRRHKNESPKKMLEAEEVRRIISAADSQMKAMVLLGLNAAFGNNDCATLPLSAISLKDAWLEFPRPKTGIDRRAPLWPETVEAIEAVLRVRPKPASDNESDLVFLSVRGTSMVRAQGSSRVDLVAIQFKKLLKKLGLHRQGIGFYVCRYVFRTIADAARDPVAIDLIMGHSDPSMGAQYRERIEEEDSRLLAVTNRVRAWLFGKVDQKGGAA